MAVTNFDVVIFDYDGTLSDTRAAIAHCLERAFAEHGRLIPPAERVFSVVCMGLSLPETCLRLDPGLREADTVVGEIVNTYRTLYRSVGEPLVKTFPGVRETLQRLHTANVNCIVVSNKGIDAVLRSLEQFALTSFVNLVFADRPGLPNKPNPALLNDHILLQFPHAAKERILMVGDTEADIEFAKNGGIASCWATYGFGDSDRCRALAPDYRIDKIGELPAIVLGDRG